MTVLSWGLLGYVVGTLPSAWLMAVLTRRRDALVGARRSAGAGDAHVLLRDAGAGRAAISAAALDVAKGLVPTAIAVIAVGPYEAAACAVGGVAGHCWPPFLAAYAGRGLATAAGGLLAILPIEMVVGGAVTGLGTLAHRSGASSSVGFLLVPTIAMWRAQPEPYVVAAWTIVVAVAARRLEGISTEPGRPTASTVWERVAFDRSR